MMYIYTFIYFILYIKQSVYGRTVQKKHVISLCYGQIEHYILYVTSEVIFKIDELKNGQNKVDIVEFIFTI